MKHFTCNFTICDLNEKYSLNIYLKNPFGIARKGLDENFLFQSFRDKIDISKIQIGNII
jgi:hypothetical protein